MLRSRAVVQMAALVKKVGCQIKGWVYEKRLLDLLRVQHMQQDGRIG
jgi:hypothetical protein